jgi:hypothetical protein
MDISLSELEEILASKGREVVLGGLIDFDIYDNLLPILYVAARCGEISVLDILVAVRDSIPESSFFVNNCLQDCDIESVQIALDHIDTERCAAGAIIGGRVIFKNWMQELKK